MYHESPYTMKLFLVVLVAHATALPQFLESNPSKLRAIHGSCQLQTGVNINDLTRVHQGKNLYNPKLGENALCLFKRTGIMDRNGTFNIKELQKRLKNIMTDDADIDRLVKACVVTDKSPQLNAHSALYCLFLQPVPASFNPNL